MKKILFFLMASFCCSAYSENLQDNLFNQIVSLAHQGKVYELSSLRQQGYDLNVLNQNRQTPMMYLYESKDIKGMQTLANLGVRSPFLTRTIPLTKGPYRAASSNYTYTNYVGNQNQGVSDFYVSGKVGAGKSEQQLRVIDNAQTQEKNYSLDETTGHFMVAFGYQLKPLRVEVESGAHLFGKDKFADKKVEAKVQSFSQLLNLYVDIPTTTFIYPYIGAGLGATYNRGKVTTHQISFQNHAWDFAWQIGGGLNVDINKQLTLDLGYRYMNFGDLYLMKECGTTYELKDEKSHIVSLGLRYQL